MIEPPQMHWLWKLVMSMLPFVLGAALVAAVVLGVHGGSTRVSAVESVDANLSLERDRVLEGERAIAKLTLHNAGGRALESTLDIGLGRHLQIVPRGPALVTLAAQETRALSLTLTSTRWGAHQLGPVRLRASDRIGLVQWTGEIGPNEWLRAFLSEARAFAGSTLDDAVRGAASLARAFLSGRDRVGLLDLAGTVYWLAPGFGDRQLYRILASEIVASYAPRVATSIRRRMLPTAGLIVAISPLLDKRTTTLLIDLHARGYETAVLEVSPLGRVLPGRGAAQLARRLWCLRREAGRVRLRTLGVAVAEWPAGAPLALVQSP
jgi:uncharacterized protein (DUF58 family)